MFVNGVELAAFDGIEKDVGGLLNAFEKGIIVITASRSALVRMMPENLFAVGALDLIFGGAVTVLGESKYCIMILTL